MGKCTLKRDLILKMGIYSNCFLNFTEGGHNNAIYHKNKKNPKAFGSRIVKGNLIVICYSCLFF